MNEQMLNPTGHHILVEVDRAKEKTTGGLYIPESAKERRKQEGTTGTLVAVGPQAWLAFADGKPWASVGDRVLCVKHAGVALESNPDLRLMNDEDVLAVVTRIDVEV